MIVFERPEKSLVPFSPQVMHSATYTAVLIVAALVTAFWPHRHLADYIRANDMPLAFWTTFAVSLIIQSYLGLRWGRGEMVKKDYGFRQDQDLPILERQIDFMPRGLAACAVHTVFLFLPFLPLLILAAAVSGMSLQVFTQASCVLLTSSLLCQTAGVTVYLVWPKGGTLGYLAARGMMIGLVFATLVFARLINPLHILYRLQFDTHIAGNLDQHAGYLYCAGVALVIFPLALVNHRLAERRRKREEQP